MTKNHFPRSKCATSWQQVSSFPSPSTGKLGVDVCNGYWAISEMKHWSKKLEKRLVWKIPIFFCAVYKSADTKTCTLERDRNIMKPTPESEESDISTKSSVSSKKNKKHFGERWSKIGRYCERKGTKQAGRRRNNACCIMSPLWS